MSQRILYGTAHGPVIPEMATNHTILGKRAADPLGRTTYGALALHTRVG